MDRAIRVDQGAPAGAPADPANLPAADAVSEQPAHGSSACWPADDGVGAKLLDSVFLLERCPGRDLRQQLAAHLGISMRQVQVWFQNKRARAKNAEARARAVQPAAELRPGLAMAPGAIALGVPAAAAATTQSQATTNGGIAGPSKPVAALGAPGAEAASVPAPKVGTKRPAPTAESILATARASSLVLQQCTAPMPLMGRIPPMVVPTSITYSSPPPMGPTTVVAYAPSAPAMGFAPSGMAPAPPSMYSPYLPPPTAAAVGGFPPFVRMDPQRAAPEVRFAGAQQARQPAMP